MGLCTEGLATFKRPSSLKTERPLSLSVNWCDGKNHHGKRKYKITKYKVKKI